MLLRREISIKYLHVIETNEYFVNIISSVADKAYESYSSDLI